MADNYASFDELPLALSADEVAGALGISKMTAYNLMHSESFPTVHVGKRMIVPKDKFIKWLDLQAAI